MFRYNLNKIKNNNDINVNYALIISFGKLKQIYYIIDLYYYIIFNN